MVFMSSINPKLWRRWNVQIRQVDFKMWFPSVARPRPWIWNEAPSSDWVRTETSHHHLPSWLRQTISTFFVCLCVSVGRSKTPVQSLFNFPDIKLHGRAISGAADYRKVILKIINRPRSCVLALGNLCLHQWFHMHTKALNTRGDKSQSGCSGSVMICLTGQDRKLMSQMRNPKVERSKRSNCAGCFLKSAHGTVPN